MLFIYFIYFSSFLLSSFFLSAGKRRAASAAPQGCNGLKKSVRIPPVQP